MKKKAITEIDILKRGGEILSRPNAKGFGWTKDTLARNLHSHPVGVAGKSACKFCTIGAVERAAHELGVLGDSYIRPKVVQSALNRLRNVMDGSIASANDDPKTTFPQVLIAFDLAQTDAGLAY